MWSTTREVNPTPTGADRELVYRFRWNLTQVVALAMGVFFMALGGIALARAGAVGIADPITPDVTVAWWHRTPLMAIIELGLGLVLIVSGAQRLSPRSLYRVAGAVALVFGIVLAAQPSTFDAALGASRNTGLLYTLLGMALLGLGFGAPVVFERERVSPVDEAVAPGPGEAPAGPREGSATSFD